MKRYGKYIRPYWYAFILGPLLMLTEVAGEVLLPSFMADIINIGAANHDVGYIVQKGIIKTDFRCQATDNRTTTYCMLVIRTTEACHLVSLSKKVYRFFKIHKDDFAKVF